jgi:predicted nucleotide-binding protein
LGFFVGRLGRDKVCALYSQGVEIPSDYRGVGYIEMDQVGGWKIPLAREMKNVGIQVNMNRVV